MAGERNAWARSSLPTMLNPAARLPAAIAGALAECALLPIKPALARTLAELLRCTPATDPARRFRVTVGHLCERLGKSDATVDRYLAQLKAAGWICREQATRGARRHGWRASWTWLTDQALQALGLQRGSFPRCDPKPCSKGEAAWRRVRRIPQDLAALAERVGPARVVWLMARCRSAGRRLQEFAAQAMQADSPAGYVLRALSARKCSSVPQSAPKCPEVPSGGDARRDARDVLREIDAGPRTEAGRLKGLAMLRAVRR